MLSDRRGWEEDTSKGSGGSGALLLEDVTGLGMQISSPHGWNQVRGHDCRHCAATPPPPLCTTEPCTAVRCQSSDLGVVCRGGAWGQVEILATGSRVRMAVNGVALLDYTDPNPELISAGP